jgi:hypothetical protein
MVRGSKRCSASACRRLISKERWLACRGEAEAEEEKERGNGDGTTATTHLFRHIISEDEEEAVAAPATGLGFFFGLVEVEVEVESAPLGCAGFGGGAARLAPFTWTAGALPFFLVMARLCAHRRGGTGQA